MLNISLTFQIFPTLIVVFISVNKKVAYSEDIWQAALKSVAVFWETQGAICHGHEIVGFENIPEKGSGLLIYYHATFPIDFYYVYSKIALYKNRRFKIIADKFLFKVPGNFYFVLNLLFFVEILFYSKG